MGATSPAANNRSSILNSREVFLALKLISNYHYGMKASRWYKEFGSDREERYYHITEIEEGGLVSGTLYIYNSLFRKVVKEESRRFDDKWWMEQELRNSVHEVAESSIPFLMKF